MPADNTNRSAPSELMKVTDQRLKGKVIAQYAAVCVRPNLGAENDIQLLLITSRGSRRWVIPKGCRIPRKKPHEVARQEAWEEAGVRGQVKKKPVGALHLCQETEGTRSSARPRPGSLAKCLGARTRLSGGGATRASVVLARGSSLRSRRTRTQDASSKDPEGLQKGMKVALT